jgi:Zn-finger nucleic acid-binding protein
MALTCPQCAAQMQEVRAPARVGYLIVLDQCPRCGGIWCDRWELYPLSAAAAGLDRLDADALVKPVAAAAAQLVCPRCRARMRRFRDPALPQDARIERCPNCDGMWLNRGELRRLKAPGETPAAGDVTISDAELDRLAHRANRDPGSQAAVSTLPHTFEASEDTGDPNQVYREVTASVAWLVLRAVLRVLFHI